MIDLKNKYPLRIWLITILIVFSCLLVFANIVINITSYINVTKKEDIFFRSKFETETTIGSFIWFYDTKAIYDNELELIKIQKSYLDDMAEHTGILPPINPKDMVETLRQLQVLYHTCENWALTYNRESVKYEAELLRKNSLPNELPTEECRGDSKK